MDKIGQIVTGILLLGMFASLSLFLGWVDSMHIENLIGEVFAILFLGFLAFAAVYGFCDWIKFQLRDKDRDYH